MVVNMTTTTTTNITKDITREFASFLHFAYPEEYGNETLTVVRGTNDFLIELFDTLVEEEMLELMHPLKECEELKDDTDYEILIEGYQNGGGRFWIYSTDDILLDEPEFLKEETKCLIDKILKKISYYHY